MNISPSTLETIKYVKIGKVADYLRTKKWIEEGQISDRASVWTKTLSPEGKIEILLPLQYQAPDFFRRMTEVLETLEIAEQISQTEILNDLISTSQIASKMGREILKLKLSLSDPTKEEVPISNLGRIIDTLQSVINAIGQAKDGTPTMKGAIPQKIIDQTKLSVFGSFVGSFGLKLAASEPPSQRELLKEPLVIDTIDEFLELIRDSNNPERLHKRLLNLKKRSASSYLKFLVSLLTAESNLQLDWGSTNTERGGIAELSLMTIGTAIDIVKKVEMESPETYEVVGEWIGGNKRKQDFEITDTEGKRYSGIISDIVLMGDVQMSIGSIYVATIEETVRTIPITNEGIPEYKLINLRTLG